MKSQLVKAIAQPWVEWLMRLGFAAKGIIYLVIGILAAEAALGWGGAVIDSSGALVAILRQPFGRLLLGLLAVGLCGHVLWLFTQALLDPEHDDKRSFRSLSRRLQYGSRGLIYIGSAWTAAQLLLGLGIDVSDSTKALTAQLLKQPLGQWIVGSAGLAVIIASLFSLRSVFVAKSTGSSTFQKIQMEDAAEDWVMLLERWGNAARSAVFTMVGFCLLKAAILYDSTHAAGMAEALQALAEPPFGSLLLGAIAVGFIAYAVYMLVLAWYRRLAIAPD